MNQLNSFIKPATRTFWRSALKVRKYSPELLLGAGVAGVGLSLYGVYKATLKLDEIKKETEERLEKIEDGHAHLTKDVYSDEDYERDLKIAKIQGAMKIVKLYGPSISVAMLSVGAIAASHHILSQRNVALLGAYKLLEVGFDKYRERVIDSLGSESDNFFRFGGNELAFNEAVGNRVKELKENKKLEKKEKDDSEDNLPACYKLGDESIYAKYFDESSVQFKKDNVMNLFFLKAQQNFANDMLQIRGHVFLNEVYDMLDLPRTKAGAIVGWVKDKGDNFIDFGIYNPLNDLNRDYINGYARAILLDFNVDGVIYDLI